MQIIVTNYDVGYEESLMIGKKHFDVSMAQPACLVDKIEWADMEAAYTELIKMIHRLYMRDTQYYTIVCVVNACIYRVMFAVDHEGVVNYEYIDADGVVENGRFPA